MSADARELTLDPDTVYKNLFLSEREKKVYRVEMEQPYPDQPQRFDGHVQVLCKEPLTGRCYWECEWMGIGACIAIAYESMNRKGTANDSSLGCNDKSWLLWAHVECYEVMHNNVIIGIPGPLVSSNKLGVYLDRQGGILSFYSVPDRRTCLYTFNTTFTDEHIYAGFWVDHDSQVSLCQII